MNWLPSRYTGMPVSCRARTVKSAVHDISCGRRNSPRGTAKNRNASGKAIACATAVPSTVGTASTRSATSASWVTELTEARSPSSHANASSAMGASSHGQGARAQRSEGVTLAPDQPERDRRHEEGVRERVRARPDRHHRDGGVVVRREQGGFDEQQRRQGPAPGRRRHRSVQGEAHGITRGCAPPSAPASWRRRSASVARSR